MHYCIMIPWLLTILHNLCSLELLLVFGSVNVAWRQHELLQNLKSSAIIFLRAFPLLINVVIHSNLDMSAICFAKYSSFTLNM